MSNEMINEKLNLPYYSLNIVASGNSEQLDLQFKYSNIENNDKPLNTHCLTLRKDQVIRLRDLLNEYLEDTK